MNKDNERYYLMNDEIATMILWLKSYGHKNELTENIIDILTEYPNLVKCLDQMTVLYKNKKRKLFRINGALVEYDAGHMSAESALKHIRDILKENF